MRRFMILFFIAILTFVAILYVKRPDILGNLWLWLIGLAGPIIGLFKRLVHEATEHLPFLKGKRPNEQPKPVNTTTTAK